MATTAGPSWEIDSLLMESQMEVMTPDEKGTGKVLLYADILGMKARWQSGISEVLAAYAHLERMVVNGVRRSGHVAVGGIQSDAVALSFPSVASAVLIGRRLFQRSFSE